MCCPCHADLWFDKDDDDRLTTCTLLPGKLVLKCLVVSCTFPADWWVDKGKGDRLVVRTLLPGKALTRACEQRREILD